MLKKVVVAIYLHPDYYPPTINAINCLAEICQELVVITNNNCTDDFFIGNNIKFIKIGKLLNPIEFEKQSTLYKVLFFIKFSVKFFWQSISSKTSLILMYDSIPLFSYYLFQHFLSKKKTSWFHSHDMPIKNKLRKFSIGWFGAKYELDALQKVTIFSLPTNDRLKYYPRINSKTQYFELPNFPSKKIYNQITTSLNVKDDNVIKIIYQGTLGPNHSLEEIIPLLNRKINGKSLQLTLKGKVKEDYEKKLKEIAEKHQVNHNLIWIGIGFYRDLQAITKQHEIGIAIHLGNIPQGTASNKIYEYAACGLPALVYDNEQFRKHLSGYDWAVFTDGTPESLFDAIKYCNDNFAHLSKCAKNDFNNNFFFEKGFEEIKKYLIKPLTK